MTPVRLRGQANLLAVAVALVVLTAAIGFGLAMADGAYAAADREPGDRYVAVALADRLTEPDSRVAIRRNVIDREAIYTLTADSLDRAYPVARGADIRIQLDDQPVLHRGDPSGGATIRRIVTVATTQTVTRRPPLDGHAVTIPRRTDRIRLTIQPPPTSTVRSVRTNGRLVLRDPDGLDGTFDVRVSRYETVRVTLDATGALPRGSVTVTYYPERSTKAVLAVTADG